MMVMPPSMIMMWYKSHINDGDATDKLTSMMMMPPSMIVWYIVTSMIVCDTVGDKVPHSLSAFGGN